MKLSVLVLLVLLGLSWAYSPPPQDIVRKRPQHTRVSVLNPDLEERVPIISANGAAPGPLTPAELELEEQQEHQEQPSSFVFVQSSNLQWLSWNGGVPYGAVSIYNDYTGRTDYVCKYGTSAGFYSPRLGSYCHYPLSDREHRAQYFDILVNKDNFEILEWEGGSWGSVPQHSVSTSPGGTTYVGKNQYGLGKVVPQHGNFFLPFEGYEYWYKSYEVLTTNMDAYSQRISNVRYSMGEAKLFKNPPEALRISMVTNNECQSVTKTVAMSEKTEKQSTWNTGLSTTQAFESSITAEIPFIGSGSIVMGSETTQEFSHGTAIVKDVSHFISIEVPVPPNHFCSVYMEGRKMTVDIPYTAQHSRSYRNGVTRVTNISGTYKGVEVGLVQAVINRCEPVADARPCP